MNHNLVGRGRTKIRPPRKVLSGAIDVEKSWDVLQKAIEEIQQKNASKLSFEELYRRAYNLVLHKHGKFLYDRIETQIRDHLRDTIRVRLLEKLQNPSSDDRQFLQEMNSLWEDHLLSMRMISDVLMYLDRVYAKESHLPLIYDVGLNAFKDSVIKYNNNEIGKAVIKIVLDFLNQSRHGIIVDKFSIKAMIYMLESLTETVNIDVSKVTGSTSYGENYYLRYFEPKLLVSGHEYFQSKAKELIDQHSGVLYIEKIVQLIQEEEARIQMFLPDTSGPKIVELMDNDLISQNLESIMMLEADGLKAWIAEANFAILNQLFKLISRVDSDHEMLKRRLRAIILLNGEELSENVKQSVDNTLAKKREEEDKRKQVAKSHGKKLVIRHKSGKEQTTLYAIKWIESFLELKNKYDDILKKSFEMDVGLSEEVQAGFTTLINTNKRSEEYLSLFIDNCIRRSLKNKSSEEIDRTLNACINVFRFIKDKDVFEKYNRNHLAKRLLQQKSLSNEIEMSMITKLKQEIGSSFTARLEGMFKDVKLSQEMSNEFNNKFARQGARETGVGSKIRAANNGRKLELEFSILTPSFWPMPINKAMDDVILPPELQILKDSGREFYDTKHKGRNLTWAPNFGTVDIRMHYPSNIYEVNMSTLSATIMLSCFNEDDSNSKEVSFEQILEKTGIPEQELKRHLQSISVASRTRLLKKIPMSRDIHSGDMFKINEQFKSPHIRIKVLTVAAGSRVENDSERNGTLEVIKKSRIVETQAAIVRVMKARRVLKHEELLNEVVKQLMNRFKPQPAFIKEQIEELIDKEYLKRDDNDRSIYQYLA